MKKCLSYLIGCFLVSKHTNEVLKEIARWAVTLFVVLFLSIDWDATLDAWEVLSNGYSTATASREGAYTETFI